MISVGPLSVFADLVHNTRIVIIGKNGTHPIWVRKDEAMQTRVYRACTIASKPLEIGDVAWAQTSSFPPNQARPAPVASERPVSEGVAKS